MKSQVGREMFQKIVQRKSWSPGEESSIDGKASEKGEDVNVEIKHELSEGNRSGKHPVLFPFCHPSLERSSLFDRI